MSQLRRLLPLIAVLLVGCSLVRTAKPVPEDSTEGARIQRRLDEIFDAAQKKDLARLDSYHAYGPKFTKFAVEDAGREDAATARQGEHDGLASAVGLSMKAEDLKIDVFGDVGIATFVLSYSFKAGAESIAKKERSTLIFVKEHDDWKITHEHFSAIETGP
jgi:ketosteroid isomerase-like protein